MNSSSSSTSSDGLSITLTPYGHIEWRGPRAKIEASGLIPPDFEWPSRLDYAHWSAGGFHYLLRRCRPDGRMGPMKGWMRCDFWFMRRSIPRALEDQRCIHEPYRDLADILFQATRTGDGLQIKLSQVHTEKSIEPFTAQLLPLPVKRNG